MTPQMFPVHFDNGVPVVRFFARGFPVAVYVPHTVAASRRHVTRWAGRKLVQTWHGWWIMHGFDTESLRRLGCLGTQLWETWLVMLSTFGLCWGEEELKGSSVWGRQRWWGGDEEMKRRWWWWGKDEKENMSLHVTPQKVGRASRTDGYCTRLMKHQTLSINTLTNPKIYHLPKFHIFQSRDLLFLRHVMFLHKIQVSMVKLLRQKADLETVQGLQVLIEELMKSWKKWRENEHRHTTGASWNHMESHGTGESATFGGSCSAVWKTGRWESSLIRGKLDSGNIVERCWKKGNEADHFLQCGS